MFWPSFGCDAALTFSCTVTSALQRQMVEADTVVKQTLRMRGLWGADQQIGQHPFVSSDQMNPAGSVL